jgi:hypothetical protein
MAHSLLPTPPPDQCRGLRKLEDDPDGYPRYACRKCGYESGDSWIQCEGSCPVEQSPHFDPACLRAFEEIPDAQPE